MNFCLDCHKEISRKKQYKRCRKCSHLVVSRKRTKERPNCLDCKVKLKNLKSIRCKSCNNKERWKTNLKYVEKMLSTVTRKRGRNYKSSLSKLGEKNPAWKGGI